LGYSRTCDAVSKIRGDLMGKTDRLLRMPSSYEKSEVGFRADEHPRSLTSRDNETFHLR
jgi:hypothetical protein